MTNETTRAPRPWYRVEARAAEGDSPTAADVYVYDEIGESWWGGLSPKSLIDEITALDVDTLTVHINSPGGAAWDGITIMNALRRHSARVDVVVDGLAASAASVIAMAGDTVTMNRGAQMMIHDASGGAWGNAQTMEETAGILHKLSDSYADIYAARAGGDRAQWREAMQAESWYTAEEAVAAGLADAWDGSSEDPEPVASFDLTHFRFQGRAHAPTPILGGASASSQKRSSSPEPGTPNQKEALTMSDTIKAGLRERLGVTDAEASEETLLAALDEALAEQAEIPAAIVATIPDGAVVIDAAALAVLQVNAEAGVEARREQESARRDSIVATAIKEGRIAPAGRDTWRAQLDKDEDGITTLLNSFPANTVPVAEVGHSDKAGNADDALYAAAWGQTEKEA